MDLGRWLPLAVGALVAVVVVAIESDAWVALLVGAALVMLPLLVRGLRKLLQPPNRPPLSWVAGLLFIIVVAGSASVFELTSEERTGPERCTKEYKNPVPPGSAHSGGARPIPVGLDGSKQANPQLTFKFGHTSSAIIRRQSFTAKGAGAKAYGFTLLADLTDDETGNDLPPGTIKGKIGSVSVLRAGMRLSVCIDPEPLGEPRIDPGTYTGAVALGTRAEREQALTSIPVTVSIADDRDLVAMAAVLIGVIAGIIVRAAGDMSQATGRRLEGQADEKAPVLPPDPRDYFFSFRFLVMLAGGLIGGILVYGPLFADAPDATVDLFDSLVPLAAAAFTATLAAKSLADLKGPTLNERAQGLSGKPLTVREQEARKSLKDSA